jgi:transcriptional regulator with XRE-family HTH domain
MDELAACLRTWRDRLQPDDAGGRRRAPGLRREEVAQRAGLSIDYLARLEQGRADNPSPSVLAPLARALELSDAERDHLYRVAGAAPPTPGQIDRRITPAVRRVLDGLADAPVLVTDSAWTVIAANPLARELLGTAEGNIAARYFAGETSRVVRTPEEAAHFERELVGDLHDALGRYPDDEPLRELIAGLRESSPRFAELWEGRPVAPHIADRKTIEHPQLGRVTLDCDVLTVRGSELRMIVYTAPPGSADAEALAELGMTSFRA